MNNIAQVVEIPGAIIKNIIAFYVVFPLYLISGMTGKTTVHVIIHRVIDEIDKGRR